MCLGTVSKYNMMQIYSAIANSEVSLGLQLAANSTQ